MWMTRERYSLVTFGGKPRGTLQTGLIIPGRRRWPKMDSAQRFKSVHTMIKAIVRGLYRTDREQAFPNTSVAVLNGRLFYAPDYSFTRLNK
jgi:hypothetical protein